MAKNSITLSELVKLTGAKPYQVKYLYSLGILPTVRGSQGAGFPIQYKKPESIQIVKDSIRRGK